VWMFSVSGLLIALAAWSVYRPGRRCPTDPELAKACQLAGKWNKRFITLSAVMWLICFLAVYALPLLQSYPFLSVIRFFSIRGLG